MIALDLTEEECKSLLTTLEAYKLNCLKCGLDCHLPKHYGNIISILNQLHFVERVFK